MATNAHSIRIDAPEQEIIAALTTRVGLQGWYTPKVEGATGKGSEVVLHFSGKEGPFRWKIREAGQDNEVIWDCLDGPGASSGTAVVFRLAGSNERGTTLELDHEGLDEEDEKNKVCNTMWGALMLHLKNYVETKHPQPAFQ